MSKQLEAITHSAGKATVATMLSLLCVLALAIVFDVQNGGHADSAMATSTATTSVTVLNTPPAWTVTARELYASATTTPTNSGTSTVWVATATDSNGENYYFVVCKASSTPTANASAAPVCGGGLSNQWGVSASTASGIQAQVSTTTTEAMPEKNDWYGYVCDANAGNPRCNAAMYNGLHEAGGGTPTATSSPFVVNHRPTFTAFADDSPTLPGANVTWTSTASDADTIGSADTVQLHVCKAADFSTTTLLCGAGGYWASSTFAASNPSTSTTITIPTQDKDFVAYGYVVDTHGHAATGGQQGVDSVLTVANAAPYIASSTITVYDRFGSTTIDTNMNLLTEEGQTSNFVMRFDVSDNNSCLNSVAGNEITDADINVFRSGVGGTYGAGCDVTGEFNANNCYTHTNSWWVPTCYQVAGAPCTSGTLSVTWECTFPLWYVADPTDLGSQYPGEDWRGAARATDDDASTGQYSVDDEVANGASQMIQFLSFRATGSPIAYGSWEPGQNTGKLIGTTTVYATGNTGLDEYLSGDAMCVGYPSTCTGYATSTIYVPYQEYSLTPNTNYGSGTDLSTSTAPVEVEINIPKTTATSTPANDDTYWGIAVPSSITFAGDYLGRNYIDAIVGESVAW